MHHKKHWKYTNTAFLLLSLVVFFVIAQSDYAKHFILIFEGMGIFGIFIAGMFFVSTFTIIPASAVLYYFAIKYDPLLVAVVAGLGSVMGDYVIFKFLKDKVFEELSPLLMEFGGSRIKKLIHTPYFSWTAPIIGAAIVASPLPDEVGLGLMGVSKIKDWQFVALLFALDTVGIYLIALAARAGHAVS